MRLGNQGLITMIPTPYGAYKNTYNFDIGADVYYRSFQLRYPITITTEQMDEKNQT